MSKFAFSFITPAEAAAGLVKPGTIMFLPPRDQIPKSIHTDPSLHIGAFNHPIVVISCPDSKKTTLDSTVKIAIMTSFAGTSFKKHLSTKGIKARYGATVAHRAGYLRVATASKLHTKDTLKLRSGKGMKRDYSYINCKDTYSVSLRALARYGFGKEGIDAYQLTSHATKVLSEEILRKCRRKIPKTKEE